MARVMIVDDDWNEADGLCKILEEAGYDVETAPDLAAALERVPSSGLDLLLLDSATLGGTLASHLRALARLSTNAGPPILLFASPSFPNDILRSLDCGARNFLAKPVRPHRLLAMVAGLVHGAEAPRAGKPTLRAVAPAPWAPPARSLGCDPGRDFLTSALEELLLDRLESSARACSDEPLREALVTFQPLFRALAGPVTLLDAHGRVLAPGEPESREVAGPPRDRAFAVGVEYLQACAREFGAGSDWMRRFSEGLRTVLSRPGERFELECPCAAVGAKGGERLEVVGLSFNGHPVAAVAHRLAPCSLAVTHSAPAPEGSAPPGATEPAALSEMAQLLRSLQERAQALLGDLTETSLYYRDVKIMESTAVSAGHLARELVDRAAEAPPVGQTLGASVDAEPASRAEISEIGQLLRSLQERAQAVLGELTETCIYYRDVKIMESTAGSARKLARQMVDRGVGAPAAGAGAGAGAAPGAEAGSEAVGADAVEAIRAIEAAELAARLADPPAFGATEGTREASESAFPPTSERKTILVADDEPAVLDILRDILQDDGFTVLTAIDGEDALRKAEGMRDPLDLSLIDVEMPRMNGPALAARLRSRRLSTRILYMSGVAEGPDLRERVGAEDAAYFLRKPFSAECLSEMIQTVLSNCVVEAS